MAAEGIIKLAALCRHRVPRPSKAGAGHVLNQFV
jgi:hypothetical protein